MACDYQLSHDDVRAIRKEAKEPICTCGRLPTRKALAGKYGVSPTAIHKVITGKSYGNVE